MKVFKFYRLADMIGFWSLMNTSENKSGQNLNEFPWSNVGNTYLREP